MSGSCRAYELVSGVFAKSIGTSSIYGSRHFIISDLPSRNRPSFQFTVREDVGIPSKDFVIDPTQDLIGYVSESVPPSPKSLPQALTSRFPETAFSLRARSKYTS